MAEKNPFKYSEVLKGPAISRLPSDLVIPERNQSYLLLLIRLLSGNVRIKHEASGVCFEQKDNYFSEDLKSYGQRWDSKFPKLFGEEYKSADLADFLNKTRNNHRRFYRNLLADFSYFFYYQKKKAHASAFIFVYRILEHISYALPMIYASRTKDFLMTFNSLKEMVGDDKKKGELGFFKSFVSLVLKDDPVLDTTVDFPIHARTEDEQKFLYDTIKNYCNSNIISDSTEYPRVLRIKYTEVPTLVITIRNKFFHNMNGYKGNLEAASLPDVDQLFYQINKKSIYWITTIFLVIISNLALQHDNKI